MEIGKYYLRDGSVTTDIRQWVKQFDENKTVAQTTLPRWQVGEYGLSWIRPFVWRWAADDF